MRAQGAGSSTHALGGADTGGTPRLDVCVTSPALRAARQVCEARLGLAEGRAPPAHPRPVTDSEPSSNTVTRASVTSTTVTTTEGSVAQQP